MNNTLKTSLTLLLITVSAMVLSYCHSDSDVKPAVKPVNDEIVIQSNYLFSFKDKYSAFIEGLDVSDKTFVSKYISEEDAKLTAAKTNLEAKCQCGAGQSTCSASGQFSECCICWDPKTHTGTCGVYFGIASCRNEPISPRTRAEQATTKMKFFPARFTKMLDLLEKRGVEVGSVRADLKSLINAAE